MTNAPTLPAEPSRYWGRAMVETFSATTGKPSGDWIKASDYDALRAIATTLRDQLAEAQREIERFKARCIELELDIIDAQTVRDNSLKILGQQVERAETAEQQLAEQTARADANEKALKRIRAGLSNTPVCCGNPIDGHPGNYWEPPDAPECCREPDMLHDIIDAALAKS